MQGYLTSIIYVNGIAGRLTVQQAAYAGGSEYQRLWENKYCTLESAKRDELNPY